MGGSGPGAAAAPREAGLLTPGPSERPGGNDTAAKRRTAASLVAVAASVGRAPSPTVGPGMARELHEEAGAVPTVPPPVVVAAVLAAGGVELLEALPAAEPGHGSQRRVRAARSVPVRGRRAGAGPSGPVAARTPRDVTRRAHSGVRPGAPGLPRAGPTLPCAVAPSTHAVAAGPRGAIAARQVGALRRNVSTRANPASDPYRVGRFRANTK